MQKNPIDELRRQLFEETAGSKFAKLKGSLIKKYAGSQRAEIIDLVADEENIYAGFFEWKEGSLRLSELTEWQQNGYPDGQGYSAPVIHRSLTEPSSAFEKVVSKLDKKLQKSRKEDQDPANPSNWLVIASDKDIEAIERRWKLPEKYLSFLQNF